MEHSAGAMSDTGGNEGGAQTRTGTGPARLTVDIVEPDASNPNSWRFNPSLLDVRTGDTVVWRNRGSVGHTVTSDSGVFDSGPIQPGQTWERTFDSAGVLGYHCTPHPWMRAKLRVAEPGKDAPAVPASSATAANRSAAASTPPFRRIGTAPARTPVNIVEPDMADAMKWGFAPQVIDVKVGDTVVWHNTGSLQHSVTGDSGSFDSGLLSPGTTFDSPGVFAYHCTPHPWMKGAVRVTSDGAAPPPVPTLGSPMAPGEQAAGPMTGDTHAQPGTLGIGPISLGGPINYGSNRLFFLSLLAAAAVLWLTWLLVATPWRPKDSRHVTSH
jgi:plastocyanin